MNHAVLKHLHPEHVEVEICRAEDLAQRRGLTSELDEMWSYVGKKAEPRWLWHAIDHHSGAVLAYVFGRRQDDVFLHWQELLAPFHITRFSTDGWGAYERHLDPAQHTMGKAYTQKIESKHINCVLRCGKVDKSQTMVSLASRGGAPWIPSSSGRAMATLSGRLSSWVSLSTSIPRAKS